jgi:hypothetical protein
MTTNEDFPEMTAEQRTLTGQLAAADLGRIDQALLSNASAQWSRTDRIVLTTMIELDNGMGLPLGFFAQRLAHLVREGLLEAKGDPIKRSGEVRLK